MVHLTEGSVRAHGVLVITAGVPPTVIQARKEILLKLGSVACFGVAAATTGLCALSAALVVHNTRD